MTTTTDGMHCGSDKNEIFRKDLTNNRYEQRVYDSDGQFAVKQTTYTLPAPEVTRRNI